MTNYGIKAETASFKITAGSTDFNTHTPLPTDHIFYNMVGRVASEWSHLEHVLDLIIWELSGLRHEFAACITSQIMGVGPRCKAIITLLDVHKLDNGLAKPFRVLMNDSYSPSDWRARFIHDAWYLGVESQTPAQFRAMPYTDRRYGLCDVTEEELTLNLGRIKELQNEASRLRAIVLNALSTSQEK